MKVELNDIRIGVSAITGHCQVGIISKKNKGEWVHQKDIHNDFLAAVITCWAGQKQVIFDNEFEYEISVKKTKKEGSNNGSI